MKWPIIAINTFREAVRDKILYNLLIFALLLIGGTILLGTLSMAEQTRIILDLGLASINLFGILMAIFLGVSLVSREIERRTLYTVLAKPVGRTEFLIGKYMGLLLTLAVNTAIMTIGLYLTYMFDQFQWNLPISEVFEFGLMRAIVMIYLELALIVAVALFFSTLTTTTLATIFTLSIYVIGHVSGDLMELGAKSAPAVGLLLKGIYYLLPNLSHFDIKGEVVRHIAIAPSSLALTALYGFVYCTLLISAASFIFNRRDLR